MKTPFYLSDKRVVGILIAVAFIASVMSLVVQQGFMDGDLWEWSTALLLNFATEMLGASLTFVLLEILVRERRAYEEEQTRIQGEKQRLIHQMASRINTEAIRAAEQLRVKGWLVDGSLRFANLDWANLDNAMLFDAELQGVRMTWAKFKDTELAGANLCDADLNHLNAPWVKMRGVKLRGANLFHANFQHGRCRDMDLEGANLTKSKWEGANLSGSNLRDCIIEGMTCDAETILPDGKHWNPELDLRRYTDPTHPQFWQPRWVTHSDS